MVDPAEVYAPPSVDLGEDVECLERPLALDVDEPPVLAPEAARHVQEELGLRAHLDLVTW